MQTKEYLDTQRVTDIYNLPDSAFIRTNALLCSGFIPFSRSTLWRQVKAGHFPMPTKFSANITAWNVGSLKRWHTQVTATSDAVDNGLEENQ